MEKEGSQEFEEAYRRLIASADGLNNSVIDDLPQIREALDPDHPLLNGCPSHGSMAELIFRHIRKYQDEVNAAIKDVEKEIWKADSS